MSERRPSRTCWPSSRRPPEPGEQLVGRDSVFTVHDVVYVETVNGLRARHVHLVCDDCGTPASPSGRGAASRFPCVRCSNGATR
jgi:hypothetical protein